MTLLLSLAFASDPRPMATEWQVVATTEEQSVRGTAHPAEIEENTEAPRWAGWYDIPGEGWRWLGPGVTWSIKARKWIGRTYSAPCPDKDHRCHKRGIRTYGGGAKLPSRTLRTTVTESYVTRAYHTPGHYIIQSTEVALLGARRRIKQRNFADLYVIANDRDRRTEVICAEPAFRYPSVNFAGTGRVNWTITWESDVPFTGCGKEEVLLAFDVTLRDPYAKR